MQEYVLCHNALLLHGKRQGKWSSKDCAARKSAKADKWEGKKKSKK